MLDINSLNITEFPIIIFASPRTGCSLLGDLLAEKFNNLTYFNEPLPGNSEEFLSYASTSDSYILKIMAYDLFSSDQPGQLPRFQTLPEKIKNDIVGNNGFKIRIRRNNVLDQITSNYIANARRQFLYNKFDVAERGLDSKYTSETIPIHVPAIYDNIKIIEMRNKALDNMPVTVNLDLWYEDVDGLESSTLIKTIQPANYKELQEEIKQRANL